MVRTFGEVFDPLAETVLFGVLELGVPVIIQCFVVDRAGSIRNLQGVILLTRAFLKWVSAFM